MPEILTAMPIIYSSSSSCRIWDMDFVDSTRNSRVRNSWSVANFLNGHLNITSTLLSHFMKTLIKCFEPSPSIFFILSYDHPFKLIHASASTVVSCVWHIHLLCQRTQLCNLIVRWIPRQQKSFYVSWGMLLEPLWQLPTQKYHVPSKTL